MARITTTQNNIFKAHLEAFKNDSFDFDGIPSEGKSEDLKTALLDGKTVRALWTYIWDRRVSITSQLMASPSLNGYISKTAIKDCRDGMKHMLNSNQLNIH